MIRHVLQYSVLDEGGILTNIIWAIQMPGFMLVSGYFAAKRSKEIGKSVVKSCERYLMPFLTWWVFITVLLLGGSDRNILIGLNTLFQHVDGGLWFLWVIFILSILAAIYNRVLTGEGSISKKVFLIIIVGIVFFGSLLAVVFMTRNVSIFGIKYILYYAVFYGFGYLIRWTKSMWVSLWGKVKDIILLICLVVFLAIVFNYDLYHCDDDLISIVMRCVTGFAGNAVILCAVDRYEHVLTKVKL